MHSYICAKCKHSVDRDRIVDNDTAWCSRCFDIVHLSAFQIQGWILGVLVVLTAIVHFDLLA